MRGRAREAAWRIAEGVRRAASLAEPHRKADVSPVSALRHAGCSWSDVVQHETVQARIGPVGKLIPPSALAFLESIARHPLRSAVVTGVAKNSVGDMVAQKIVEGRRAIDWGQHGTMALFGASYVGAFQYFLYGKGLKPLHGRLVKPLGKAAATGLVLLLDQGLCAPFLYLSSFVLLKEAREKGPSQTLEQLGVNVRDRWRRDVPKALPIMWTLWVPAQALNYLFVPRALTVPYMNVVGLVWGVILSAMQGKKKQPSS